MLESIHFKWLPLTSGFSLCPLNVFKFRIAVQQYALDMRKNMYILGRREYAYSSLA